MGANLTLHYMLAYKPRKGDFRAGYQRDHTWRRKPLPSGFLALRDLVTEHDAVERGAIG
jgi:hypothetical protein